MPLKISFETDIKGFERVEKALTSQQKLLNDTAVSVDRLNAAQTQMTKGDMGIKGMESLKGTASAVNDLVGALEKLTKGQSGLRGFMDLFSQFSKQIKEFNIDSTKTVLSGIDKQLEEIKASAAGRVSNINTLKQQAQGFRDAGDLNAAEGIEVQMAKEANRLNAESSLINRLRMGKFMHTPLRNAFGRQAEGWTSAGRGGAQVWEGAAAEGGLLSGALGGATVAGMIASGASVIGGVGVAGLATKYAVGFQEAGWRGDTMVFERERMLAEQQMAGNVGRAAMLRSGVGHESDYINGGFAIAGNGRFQWGQIGRNFLAGLSYVGNFGQKDMRQIQIEKANELSEYDKQLRFGVDKATQFSVKRANVLDDIARRTGSAGVDETVSQLSEGVQALGNRGKLSFDQAAPAMMAAERAGVLGKISQNMGKINESGRLMAQANVLRSQGKTAEADAMETQAFYANPQTIFAAKTRIGISDRAEAEMFRLSGYTKTPEDAVKAWGSAVGGFQGVNTMSGRGMVSDYAAAKTSQVFGAVDPAEMTGFAGKISTQMKQEGFSDPEAIKAGVQVQEKVDQMMGDTENLYSMGIEQSTLNLGVKNWAARNVIRQMMSKGQREQAIKYTVGITGKSEEEVRSSFEDVKNTQTDWMWKIVGGKDSKEAKEAEKMGFSLAGAGMFGYGQAGASNKAWNAYENTGLFGKNEGGPLAPITQETDRDVVTSSMAKMENEIMASTDKILKAIGAEMGSRLIQEVANGFSGMSQKISESVGDLQSKRDKEANYGKVGDNVGFNTSGENIPEEVAGTFRNAFGE